MPFEAPDGRTSGLSVENVYDVDVAPLWPEGAIGSRYRVGVGFYARRHRSYGHRLLSSPEELNEPLINTPADNRRNEDSRL